MDHRRQETSAPGGRSSRLKGVIDPRNSLGAKLFLFFFTTVVVMVSVVGIQSYRIAKDSILDEVSHSSEQTLVQARQNLDLVFDKYREYSLQYISDVDFMKRLTEYMGMPSNSLNYMNKQSDLVGYMKKTMSSVDNLNGITLFHPDGSAAASTYSLNLASLEKPDWFGAVTRTQGEEVWLPSRKGFVGGKNSIGLARVLRNYDGPVAVILIEIKIEALSSQLAGMTLTTSSQEGKGGVSMLDPATQAIVYDKEMGRIGGKSPFLQLDGAKGKLEGQGIFTATHSDGTRYLEIYDQSAVTGWVLTGEVRVSDLLSSAERILAFVVVILIVSTILSVGLGYAMIRIFANPLIRLKRLMAEGARGNLAVRAPIRTKDEIGQLGEGFNAMMESMAALVRQTDESAHQVSATAEHLTDSSKQSSGAALEITAATEQIAQGAASLAIEAEKSHSLSAAISLQMEKVVLSNREMNDAAGEVNAISEQGTRYMSDLIEKTRSTERVTREMMDKVGALKESTSSIAGILNTMTAMTQQTNILSLNATIEAARAGEAGRGFAVVAGEIRKLAEQSKQSIEIVGGITRRVQEEMQDTVKILTEAYPLYQAQTATVQDTNRILVRVKDQMNEFMDRSAEVTRTVEELSRAQQGLNESISNVSAVSEETSASSQQVASISAEQLEMSKRLVGLSEEMDKLAESLQKSLALFRM
ncbi:methyl-accepting chemotaxis protein [Paenibacillus spiritus]|uniref:Methyl-accepting chemotaxis protein n=1 Tax=Paenibacillus spiritus TaxID=2496557 RepID=A0A5J5GCI4_9BACL|nr:methyl-accepting chemotaxis protein [Paenibacillus spiritus]KAA9005865.1 methyl-accepting chemotaxis protein [Paenibacillus spiritus]